MALTPERRHTMRFYAEGARSRGERVTTSPKVLLDLLDAAEAPRFPFPTIRTRAGLDDLPVDSVLVSINEYGSMDTFHKQKFKTGEVDWFTPGIARPIRVDEITLPALLLFVPKRSLPLEHRDQ